MSAATMIVDQGGVIFITDTAVYDDDAIICGFTKKTMVSRHRWAFATMGHPQLLRDLRGVAELEFDAFLELLPGALRRWTDVSASSAGFLPAVKLMLGGWSQASRRWRGFVIQNNPAGGFTPYELTPTVFASAPRWIVDGQVRGLTPAEITEDIGAHGLPDFARRVLEAQRNDRVDDIDGRRIPAVVGGQGVLTLISEAGTSQDTVVSWPDKIGQGPMHRALHPDRPRLRFGRQDVVQKALNRENANEEGASHR